MFIKNVLKADKAVKTVLFFGVILIVCLGWIVVRAVRSEPSGKELILQEALVMSFNGKVDSVFYDKENHSAKTVILTSGYKYGIYSDWQEKIALGDYLSKSKNSLKVKVVKPNGTIVILDYNELVKCLRLN